MSLHNESYNTTFIKPKKGKLVVSKTNEEYEAVSGILKGVKIYHDEGNAQHNIGPSDNLVVTLQDGEDYYDIRHNIERNFAHSLSCFLNAVNVGDEIKIRAYPASNNDQVTFCQVQIKDGDDQWVKAEWTQMAATKSERAQYIKDIVEQKFSSEESTEEVEV